MASEFISLHNGDLEFSTLQYFPEDDCPPEDPEASAVLCLHGFPDNNTSFRFQVDAFQQAGYRVLVPTMRGYEPSSIPNDGDFGLKAIAGDVIAWLDELNLDRVHLLGHDWGSAVAYVACAMAPQRFHSLATIAVPHPRRFSEIGMIKVPSQAVKSWYMLFAQLPGVSDYFMRRNDWALIRFLWRRWSPNQQLSAEEWGSLRETFARPGVLKSMLSYYRQNVSLPILLGIRKAVTNTLNVIPVPNLALTGADDGCIDTRLYDHVFLAEDFPRGFRVERIQGAGHFAHQEQPELVNALLLDWFANQQPD